MTGNYPAGVTDADFYGVSDPEDYDTVCRGCAQDAHLVHTCAGVEVVNAVPHTCEMDDYRRRAEAKVRTAVVHIALSGGRIAPTICGAAGDAIARIHHVHVTPGATHHDGKLLCPRCLNPGEGR